MNVAISFEKEECKGCELCIIWCKKGLIEFDKSNLNKKGVYPVMITRPEECTGCGNCALMCPDSIITIEKLEEKKGD